MNKVILMGRLTRDPEVRYSQGAESTAIGRYSLAVERRFKRDGEPDADFFNCTCFGKQAEFAEKYLRKGTKILVTGRIQNDNYTNREGQMVYSVQILVEEQEFAESKSVAGGVQTEAAAAPTANTASAGKGKGKKPAPQPSGDGFMSIPDGIDDELPFS